MASAGGHWVKVGGTGILAGKQVFVMPGDGTFTVAAKKFEQLGIKLDGNDLTVAKLGIIKGVSAKFGGGKDGDTAAEAYLYGSGGTYPTGPIAGSGAKTVKGAAEKSALGAELDWSALAATPKPPAKTPAQEGDEWFAGLAKTAKTGTKSVPVGPGVTVIQKPDGKILVKQDIPGSKKANWTEFESGQMDKAKQFAQDAAAGKVPVKTASGELAGATPIAAKGSAKTAAKEFTGQADFDANKGAVTVTSQYYKNKIDVDGVKIGGGEYAVTYNKNTGEYHLVEMAGGTTVGKYKVVDDAFSAGYKAIKNNQPASENKAFKDTAELYGDTTTANAVFAKHFSTHAAKLTSGEHSAYSSYQDGGYDDMNKHLWHGQDISQTMKTKIANIDSGMKKSPGLPHDTVLYRVKPSGSELWHYAKNANVGDAYKSKGFDSTSIAKGIWGGDVTLKYRAPKGLKGFFMNSEGYSSSHHSEYEYLLPRNLKWTVVGKVVHGDKVELTLEFAGEF